MKCDQNYFNRSRITRGLSITIRFVYLKTEKTCCMRTDGQKWQSSEAHICNFSFGMRRYDVRRRFGEPYWFHIQNPTYGMQAASNCAFLRNVCEVLSDYTGVYFTDRFLDEGRWVPRSDRLYPCNTADLVGQEVELTPREQPVTITPICKQGRVACYRSGHVLARLSQCGDHTRVSSYRVYSAVCQPSFSFHSSLLVVYLTTLTVTGLYSYFVVLSVT
jgi:hypothetical protein